MSAEPMKELRNTPHYIGFPLSRKVNFKAMRGSQAAARALLLATQEWTATGGVPTGKPSLPPSHPVHITERTRAAKLPPPTRRPAPSQQGDLHSSIFSALLHHPATGEVPVSEDSGATVQEIEGGGSSCSFKQCCGCVTGGGTCLVELS